MDYKVQTFSHKYSYLAHLANSLSAMGMCFPDGTGLWWDGITGPLD